MKSRKIGIILFVVISAVSGLLSMIFNGMAENSRGASITSYIGGQQVSSGRIGGNSEGFEFFSGMRTMFIIVAVICLAIAVVLAVQLIRLNQVQEIAQAGKILEINGTIALIEFNSGERKQCVIEPNIHIVQGDKGIIHTKKNYIIDFEKGDAWNMEIVLDMEKNVYIELIPMT